MKGRRQQQEEAKAYMANATYAQLENIIRDETERARRGGEVGKVARIMREAAIDEKRRRDSR